MNASANTIIIYLLTELFQENCCFYFLVLIALKLLVPLVGGPVACIVPKSPCTGTKTDRETDAQCQGICISCIVPHAQSNHLHNIRSSVDALCRDDMGQISRDLHT